MSSEKEKWLEEVFNSMEGSQRARPRPELLAKIENQIGDSKANVIALPQLRKYAAAAAVLLLINASALMYYIQNQDLSSQNIAALNVDADLYDESYINSFQLYN